MDGAEGKRCLPVCSLGAALAVLATVLALSGACSFDTATSRCEASGLRCPPGWGCALQQGVYVCIQGGCGDLVLSSGEECDDGNIDNGDGCSAGCTKEICGNSRMDSGESCDDGNRESGDGCNADCMAERCGDHIVDVSLGEVCDDGNAISSDGCRKDCKSNEACGNGTLDDHLGEQCEFMNRPFPRPFADRKDCDNDCTLPRCGDGHHNPLYLVVDPALGPPHLEECDTGAVDTPGCDRDCTFALCGDGYPNTSTYMNERIEECDHGVNNSNTKQDACRTDCRNYFCGDGVIDSNESCDDDNADNSDFCPSGPGGTCSAARCGDGHPRTVTSPSYPDPEECDAGSSNSNDQANTCREDCRFPFCGDGVIDMNEMCDPGGSYNKGEIGCDGAPVCKPDCSACMQ